MANFLQKCGCSSPTIRPPNLGTGTNATPVPGSGAWPAPATAADAAGAGGPWSGPPTFPRSPKLISYLLDVARRAKELADIDRGAALLEPWACRRLLFEVAVNSAYTMQEALLQGS